MKDDYRAFYGLNRAPFATDIKDKDILKTRELIDVQQRFGYVISLGAVGLVTGEVGSGKTTSVRYALGKLHPSEYRTLYITASSGSIMEFYRQLIDALDIHLTSNSKTVLVKVIKKEIVDYVHEKKMKIVLVIDEAYIEFVRDQDCPDSIDYLKSDKIVVGLRTFSKAYGLAGLRIGYGLMPSFLADLLKQGIIVRSMTPYGYPDCIRVNVGRHHENVRLLEALKVVLK